MLTRCGTVIDAREFTGTYQIDKFVPLNSTTLSLIEKTPDWQISLLDNNNFKINGGGKYAVGYWRLENRNDEMKLVFQNGGPAVLARLDGNIINFVGPNNILDSLFTQVLFIRLKN